MVCRAYTSCFIVLASTALLFTVIHVAIADELREPASKKLRDRNLIYITPEAEKQEAELLERAYQLSKQLQKTGDSLMQQLSERKLPILVPNPQLTDMNNPPNVPPQEMMKRMAQAADAQVEEAENRINPLMGRLCDLWDTYGLGVKYVQIAVTVLPGRRIRLDQARLSTSSNASISDKERILACIFKTLEAVNGDPVLDLALKKDPTFSISFALGADERKIKMKRASDIVKRLKRNTSEGGS